MSQAAMESSSNTGSAQRLRKASPEALALMMANKTKNDASGSQAAWVPGGKAMVRDNSRQRKLFY